MKILHYSFGLPPQRSGGLTKYFTDVVDYSSRNHEVHILISGRQSTISRKLKIREGTSIFNNVKVSYLDNSLPLALDGGIKKPRDFYKKYELCIFIEYIKNIMPDIIHVHTLMGLPIEFLKAAKFLKIKILFTTHDYYGLSPVPKFFNEIEGYDFSSNNTVTEWIKASAFSKSTNILYLYQSSMYLTIKKIKKRFLTTKINNEININFYKETETEQKEFMKLKDYYLDMYKNIDFFHFNSSLSSNVYKENLPYSINGEVLSISNANIGKVKKNPKKSKKSTRLAYIGPYNTAKGFMFILDQLSKTPFDEYEVHLFGDDTFIDIPEKFINHGKFESSEIDEVFSMFDILIVPSIWKETFGLIVLEAIEHQKKILVSSNVGSKDLLEEENIFNIDNELDFKKKLIELINKEQNVTAVYTFEEHICDLFEMYNKLISL